MATNILMPALSPTMTEGTLARWLKKEGETIKAGDVIAEIETDKATMEVEAVDEGVLGKILVAAGSENVAVNAPIAILVEPGEAVPDSAPAAPAPKPAAAPEPVAAPAPAAAAPAAPAAETTGHGPRVFASPLARRMAQQAGIDLATLKGSGPNGRIVKADIDAARGSAPEAAAPAPKAPAAAPPAQAAAAPAAPITAPHDAIPHSSMRKVIAKRLQAAKQTIPHFYLSMDVELDALLKLRAELNAQSPKEGPGAFKLSVNDLIIKAVAVALRRVPAANASFTEEAMIRYHDVDISVAVAIPDGLITPIIRKADQKGLAAISNEMKDLAARAKAGKLKPDEFQGGSFSISNLGMYGISSFSAIINPPQGGILAIGAGEKRPVVKGEQIAIATVMTVTLSCDHRVVDGAVGAEFLAAFKSIVEQPLGLML
ncbi:MULTISPECIES: pyruvate dehydrogenase complex dihydrolipoamide acetyltransferase [Acidiphilium]|uniref:Acetyltransferase component of pyruvate dehydrogenase complex n=1 Tax=Acidiphilium multivorum (strain DSM 11245 / JCM 8867 / NBRC 100883 / AIU 301) TaxID=926570 RepID=F0J5W2_ACIMA|nr:MULTISPECIES: pyruvate dehydrogenase complex dihydrolipoamide acetyltransferase [Acidiphilium]MBU6356113.1 pyruvate dehydrogenase complex dihydrolipoamide acetyltransferase [Rhodospirillales bacterium]BAJ82506.1 pyruvate dehydrogenase E2 component [Acidiphilium multivorum AIU301]GAN74067.1 dihydrolipoamide acetyltransferase/pyruvate dehydrogenase E2 component [Acidiphilium multivorum AIU301]